MRVLMALAVGVLAAAATGQIFDPDPREAILIEIDRPVLEPGESAQVTMRAGFDSDTAWCMGLVVTDLLTDADPVRFDDLRLIAPMDSLCPGSPLPFGECSQGAPRSGRVEDIIAGQLHFGGFGGGITGSPNDPMDFWSAQLWAPDALAEPIDVRLRTRSTRYVVYVEAGTSQSVERLGNLTEGSAIITIVPCRADINGDGVADLFDFLAFMNAFDAGEPLADFDFDGELTMFDFLAFQNRFDQGC